jgi:hypothetical protein
MEAPKQTTYTLARKLAYERNKETIAAKESENKRWLRYYADNKEKIAERRRAKREATEKPPVDAEKIKRYEELLVEMESLKKDVMLHRLRTTLAAKKWNMLITPAGLTPAAPASPAASPAPAPASSCLPA